MIGVLAVLVLLAGGQTAVIRGIVIDAGSSAPVADAQVAIVGIDRSTRTNAEGRFELGDLPPRLYTLTVSTIGYIFVRREVDLTAQALVDLTIPLSEGTGTYQETVTVAAGAARPQIGVPSQAQIGSAGLADLRGVAADDPMRAIQALPGVATGDDFQAEFSVRGSAFRHVGVVIDDTATPLLLHAVRGTADTGSIAMINTDTIRRGTLLTGAHPLRHGDWIGATLEFDLRDGSRDRTAGRFAVSGTSASLVAEGPVGPKKRGSWLASVRKSYVDWLIRRLEPEIDSTIGFTDAQARVVYDLTSRQQLQVLVIGGDATYREERTPVANGVLTARSKSALASLAWRFTQDRRVWSQRLSFVASEFRNQGLLGQDLGDGDSRSLIWRGDLTASLGSALTLDAGASREWTRGDELLRDYVAVSSTQVRLRRSRSQSGQAGIIGSWAQLSRRTDVSGLAGGVRVSSHSLLESRVVSPWLLAERRLGDVLLRVSAGGSSQFSSPVLIGGGQTRTAERARSFDAGLEHRLTDDTKWTVTAFARRESDIVRPTSEARVNPETGTRISAAPFPTFAATLDGTSHGVDLTIVRRAGSGFTGWIGYTWSHTRYRDADSGETFDGDFDQRHTLNVFAQQRLSWRTTVSAKLRIGSNFPIAGYFAGDPEALRVSPLRNQVRLPFYARLDLRANRTFTFDRRRLTLFVEVMNALGRRNLGQSAGSVRPNLEAPGFAGRLLPFVPSAGLLIEF